MSLSVGAFRRSLAGRLRDAGIEGSSREADLILIHLLNCSYSRLLAYPEVELEKACREAADAFVTRRLAGEPLQYILEEACFWGRSFSVKSGVLVPRPETELLVELALAYLPASQTSTFLDWGTGSGCIAATVLLERPRSRAIMAEKSPRALLQAWENLRKYGLERRALLWHSQTPQDLPFIPAECDLVVSNPPYIPTAAVQGLMREVREHEPHLALDGGPDGMDCYRALFAFAPLWLKEGGVLLLEVGDESQATAMRKMSPQGLLLEKEIPDLQGITRCMAWRLQNGYNRRHS